MTTLQEKSCAMGFSSVEAYKKWLVEVKEYDTAYINRLFVQAEHMPDLNVICVHTSANGLKRYFKVFVIDDNRLINITNTLKNAYPETFRYNAKYEALEEYSYTDLGYNLKRVLFDDIYYHPLQVNLIHY